MAELDFESLLDKNADEIRPPSPLPQGNYLGEVVQYAQTTSSKKGTPGIDYTIRITEALDDVDEDELEEFLKDSGVSSLREADKQLHNTQWITEKSLLMFKDFLEHCGVDTEGKNLKDIYTEPLGETVGVYVTQGTSQNDRVFNDISRTFKPE